MDSNNNIKNPQLFKTISKLSYTKGKNFSSQNNNKQFKTYQQPHKRESEQNYSSGNNNNINNKKNNKIIYEQYQWDFDELAIHYPALDEYVFMNEKGRTTIDWTNAKAHKTLNQAILSVQFKIHYWDMPEDQLIPAIPSRLNYLEWIYKKQIELHLRSEERQCKGVDIGTGASLIYPLLGVSKYNIKFIATEINETSLSNAKKILLNNQSLRDNIDIRISKGNIFKDVISKQDGYINFTMCNPPFFAEHEEKKVWINASMKENEYICQGGEFSFLKQMFEESKLFHTQISLYTSLVGRQSDFELFSNYLKTQNTEITTAHQSRKEVVETSNEVNQELIISEKQKTFISGIEIHDGIIVQGNTTRWIVAWKFL